MQLEMVYWSNINTGVTQQARHHPWRLDVSGLSHPVRHHPPMFSRDGVWPAKPLQRFFFFSKPASALLCVNTRPETPGENGGPKWGCIAIIKKKIKWRQNQKEILLPIDEDTITKACFIYPQHPNHKVVHCWRTKNGGKTIQFMEFDVVRSYRAVGK